MRLGRLQNGRTVRIEGDLALPLPGRLIDHLGREPAPPCGPPLPIAEASLSAPIPRPPKVICVGLNYADHAAESGVEPPEHPILFSKFPTAVIGPGDAIVLPEGATQLDYEAELAIVIGRPARNLSPDEAPAAIGGYACFNDVSEREAQLGDGQWLRGKTHDTFAPFGPWIATPDEVDPADLAIRCSVNGEVRQDSRTSEMIFPSAEIVSFCSRAFTLEPGDVIATGTPPGVALGNGRWLQPGDEVTVSIDGLGSLTNHVASA
jgi:2-keto-4-pentenoate hydratase/2-oxohepta-3-ene-1,7-dioic acid hydratase in catechol pathway